MVRDDELLGGGTLRVDNDEELKAARHHVVSGT